MLERVVTAVHDVSYQQEPVAVVAAALPMLRDHYAEVAKFKTTLNLDPDFERYRTMEKQGALHVVTARRGGELVGYSIHFLFRHPHYRTVLVGQDDIHYVVPALRQHGVGTAMRRFAIAGMERRGVGLVTARTKPDHSHDDSLTGMGFRLFELTYGMELPRAREAS